MHIWMKISIAWYTDLVTKLATYSKRYSSVAFSSEGGLDRNILLTCQCTTGYNISMRFSKVGSILHSVT